MSNRRSNSRGKSREANPLDCGCKSCFAGCLALCSCCACTSDNDDDKRKKDSRGRRRSSSPRGRNVQNEPIEPEQETTNAVVEPGQEAKKPINIGLSLLFFLSFLFISIFYAVGTTYDYGDVSMVE